MKLFRSAQLACSALMLAFMVGCASVGMPVADTFNKKMVVGYDTITWVAESAESLRTAGKLSDQDRDNIVNINAEAIAALDLAVAARRAACPFPVSTCASPVADAKLAFATSLLQGIQAYLNAQLAAAGAKK